MNLPSPMQSPDSNRSTPAQFRAKFGTYMIGVTIGFLLLGSIYYQKSRAIKRQQAEVQTTNETAPPPESTP